MERGSLEWWELQGESRYENRRNPHAKLPYPTRDKHTAEQEAAYLRGYANAERREKADDGRIGPHE